MLTHTHPLSLSLSLSLCVCVCDAQAQVKKLSEKVKDSRREMREKERQIAVSESLLKIRQPVVFRYFFCSNVGVYV